MRNKKTLSYAFLLAFILPILAFSVALAQDSDTTVKESEERVEKVMRVNRLAMNQFTRAQRALDRMAQVMGRLDSRRAKLATDGADLASVDALIVTAKKQQTDAQAALDKASTDLAAISSSEDKKQAVQTFMRSMNDLKKKVIELHRSMMAIIKEMRKIDPKIKDDRTTPTPAPAPAPAPTPVPTSAQ
jgi:uncharacterized membrane protein